MNKGKIADSGLLFYLSLTLTIICGFALTRLVDPVLVKKSGFGVIHLQFAQRPDRLLLILQSWGAEGRAFFLRWIWLDYIYPAAYGTFLFLLLRRSVNRAFPASMTLRVLSLLPLLAGVLDWVENTVEIYMMRHIAQAAEIFALHRFFVYTKWSAVFLSLVLLIGIFVAGIYQRQKR